MIIRIIQDESDFNMWIAVSLFLILVLDIRHMLSIVFIFKQFYRNFAIHEHINYWEQYIIQGLTF